MTRRPWYAAGLPVLAWSLLPLALLLVHVLRYGGVLTGTDGTLAGADQQLYLDWVRQSGSHLLIANDFRFGSSHAVFLHPMFAVSGLLWWLGVPLKLALLVWKPVAAGVLAYGVWSYAARMLAGPGRWAAVALALAFMSPVLPVLVWTGADLSPLHTLLLYFVSGEPMPAWQLWGYSHAALVIGLMPLVLLGFERRSLALTSAGALVIGWLHPWQGATLALIAAGLLVWSRFDRRRLRLLVPAAAALLPAVYELVLSHSDADWRLNATQAKGPHAPLWMLLVTLGPLVLPALYGARGPAGSLQERIVRLWPLAGFAVYLLPVQFPYHGLQGLTIPLAVLAVRGVQRLRVPAWAMVAALLVLTVPGLAFQLYTFRKNVRSHQAPYWLANGENDALRYLNHAPAPGGVLARYYLGMTVPAATGRDTWVGHFAWTPSFNARFATTEDLFAGRLDPAGAQGLVRSLRPAYVLTDCRGRADMAALLGPLVLETRRFGCATVYRVSR